MSVTSEQKPVKLLWLDIETTGLDPNRHAVMAVGMRLTDSKLNQIGRDFERELWISEYHRKEGDPKAIEFHTKSGLLQRCMARPCEPFCRQEMIEWMEEHEVDLNTYLAGSSVGFDKRFLEQYKIFEGRTAYRVVDVSTLKTLAMAWMSELDWHHATAPWEGKEAVHTPLADITHSIEELKQWATHMFQPHLVPLELDPPPLL